MIYWFCYISILILAIIQVLKVNIKFQKVFLLANGILLILFRSLRWRTGTDWNSYLAHFNNPNSREFDFGYDLLVRFIGYFTSDYTIFLLIFNFLIIYLIFYGLRILNLKGGIFLLFYFSGTAFFPVRQHLSSAILFILFAAIINKTKKIQKLPTLMIATSIHFSSFFGFLLLPLKNWIKVRSLVFMMLAILCLFLIEGVIERIILKILFYSETTLYERNFYLGSFLKSLFLLIVYFLVSEKTKYRNYLIYGSLLYIITNYIVGYYFGEFGRIAALFHLIYLLMVSQIFHYILSRSKSIILRLGIISIMILVSFYEFYNNLYNNIFSDLFLPYFSVFSNQSRLIVY